MAGIRIGVMAGAVLALVPAIEAGYLGISGLERAEGEGLRIEAVVPDGPAAKAGLAAGDVLLSMDGLGAGSAEAFSKQVRETPAGQEVLLRYRRDGKPAEARAVLGESPLVESRGIRGRKAPPWDVSEWHNLPKGKETLDVGDCAGKVVYLYFFQSWCPGCHSNGFPALKELVGRYKDADDVAFVAVQTVFEGFQANTPEKAWLCAKKYGLTIPFGHDGREGAPSRLVASYRTGGTPWMVILDKQGVVRANTYVMDTEDAAALIEALRKEEARPVK